MNTLIFETYEKFCSRPDKAVNGVSPSFAKYNPDYKEQNKSNLGCWDCKGCKECVECVGCLDCRLCNNCSNCQDSTRCFVCDSCVSCARCEMCSKLFGCISCLSVHDDIGVRHQSNVFNKSKDKALKNPSQKNVTAFDLLIAFFSITAFLFLTK